MPAVFIHIGMPKTGSSFLQQSVFPKLAAFHFIPRKQLVAMDAYSQLLAADDTLYPEQELIRWRDQLPDQPLILSDESLSGKLLHWQSMNRSTVARRLKSLFPDAKILLVLRGQESLILSMYKEYLKRPKASLTLPELLWFPDKTTKDPFWKAQQSKSAGAYFDSTDYRLHLDSFKYCELVKLYESLFSEVKVLLYEELVQDGALFLEQIRTFLEIGSEQWPSIQHSNVYASPGMREMRIKRWVNARRQVLPGKWFPGVLHRLGRLVYHPNDLDWEQNYIREVSKGYFESNNQALFEWIGQLDRYPEAYRRT